MIGVQKNYVDICNWASEALTAVSQVVDVLTDYELAELRGLLREEISASDGRPPVSLTISMAVVEDETHHRAHTRPVSEF